MRKLKLNELNRISTEDFKSSKKIPLIIILDNIRSQHNVGSVFRTADAFRVEKICLCGITATPPHREIHKTALGATDSVDWEYYNQTMDALNELKEKGYKIISVEQTEGSTPIDTLIVKNDEKYAVVLGNEVKGVDQEVVNQSDLTVELPQFGTKHSLNVSVCTGIVIWEFFKRLGSTILE